MNNSRQNSPNSQLQESKKREEFKFRYSPYAETPDGVLMAYVKEGNRVNQGKEMLLEPARAFWLALAYQSQGDLDPEELRLIGLHCCRTLEKQADYIRQCLQLPQPTYSQVLLSHVPNTTNASAANNDRSHPQISERATQTMWQ